MCSDTLKWSFGHSDDTDCKNNNNKLFVRVSPGPEAVQVYHSSEVLCQVKNDEIKIYRKRLFYSIHRLLGTSQVTLSRRQGGESRVPAGGNGGVDFGEPEVKHQREQQLLSGAGTAQQVGFVPCSEAVPSSLRSPSNTLCAALKSVGSSPEHSRKTRRACQESVFRAVSPALASPALGSDVWEQEVLRGCSHSSALTSGAMPGLLVTHFLGTGAGWVRSCRLPGKGKCTAASEQSLAAFCRVSTLWMHKDLWMRESCSESSSSTSWCSPAFPPLTLWDLGREKPFRVSLLMFCVTAATALCFAKFDFVSQAPLEDLELQK